MRSCLLLLYLLSYVAALLFTSTFVQADLFLDSQRILIPFHAFAIVLAVSIGNGFYRKLKSSVLRAAVAACCVAITVCFLLWTIQWTKETAEDGQGYASSAYTESPLVQAVRSMPSVSRFYSNLPWPIVAYTDRVCVLLPIRVDNATLRENNHYRDQMQEFAKTMRKPGVFLALFKEQDDWFSFPTLQEIEGLVPLRIVTQTEDGVIYEARDK